MKETEILFQRGIIDFSVAKIQKKSGFSKFFQGKIKLFRKLN